MFHNMPPTSPKKAHENYIHTFHHSQSSIKSFRNKLWKTLNWTLISKKYLHCHSLDYD